MDSPTKKNEALQNRASGLAKLAAMGTSSHVGLNIPQDISAIQMSGLPVNSMFELLKEKGEEQTEEDSWNPNYYVADMDRKTVGTTIRFNEGQIGGRLKELYDSGRRTADALIQGENAASYGFVVMTKQSHLWYEGDIRMKDMNLEEKLVAERQRARGVVGAIYKAKTYNLADGKVRVDLAALGVSNDLRKANKYSRTMSYENAKEFLNTFNLVDKSGLRSAIPTSVQSKSTALRSLIPSQYALLKHSRMVDSIRSLSNYEKFSDLVKGTGTEYPIGSISSLGLHAAFSDKPRRLANRLFDPMYYTGPTKERLTSVLNAFDLAVAEATKNLDQSASESYRTSAFRDVMTPYIESLIGKANMPIPFKRTSAADVINMGRIHRSGGLAAGIERRFNAMQPFLTPIINARLNGLGPSDDAYIRARLSALDEVEKNLPYRSQQVFIKGDLVTDSRMFMYNRIRERVLGGKSKHGNDIPGLMSNVGDKFDVNFTFREASEAGNIGNQILVSFTPKGEAGIAEGDRIAGQIAFPVPDQYGNIISESGSKYSISNFGLSDVVRENAHIAVWDNRLQMISQGLAQHAYNNPLHTYSRAGKKLHLYTPSEIIAATMMDARWSEYKKAINSNRLYDLGNIGRNAFNGTLLTDMEVAEQIPKYFSQLWFKHRNSIAMPNFSIMNPFDLMSLETSSQSVNLNVFKDLLSGNYGRYFQGKGHLVTEAKKKLEPMIAGLKSYLGDPEDPEVTIESMFKRLSYSIGLTGAQNKRVNRLRSQYGAIIGANFGYKASKDSHPVLATVAGHGWIGGVPENRPMQQFKPILLKEGTGSSISRAQVLSEEGYDEINANVDVQRNIRVGHITGGQRMELNEAGELVPSGEMMTAKDIMKEIGANEQQALMNDAGRVEFGEDAYLHGAKVMAHMGKNTVAMTGKDWGNPISWEGPIQMFGGVDAAKIMGKHNGSLQYQLGLMQRLLTETSLDKQAPVAAKIAEYLGDQAAVTVANNMINVRYTGIKRAGLLGYGQLNELFKLAGLQQDGSTILTQGKRFFRLNYIDTLLPTKIIAQDTPTTGTSARDYIYRGKDEAGNWIRPRRGPRVNQSNSSALNVLNATNEGNLMDSWMTSLSNFGKKRKSGSYYKLGQLSAAYLYSKDTNNATALFDSLGGRMMTQDDLYLEAEALGKYRADTSFSKLAEYRKLYGEGLRAIDNADLPSIGGYRPIGNLVIPDENPRRQHGKISPTKLQRRRQSLMQVINEAKGGGGNQEAYKRTWTAYNAQLAEEFGGDEGIVNEVFNQISAKGLGVSKGLLAQNIWGEYDPEDNPTGMRPFEVRVGRQQAELLGIIDPNVTKTDNGKFALHGSFAKPGSELKKIRSSITATQDSFGIMHTYAHMIREPEATTGRNQFLLTIDPKIQGDQIFYHPTSSEVQMGDSDGDVVALHMIGLHDGTIVDHGQWKEANDISRQIVENKRATIISRQSLPIAGELIEGNDAVTGYLQKLLPTRMQRIDGKGPDGFLPQTVNENEEMVAQRAVENAQGLIGNPMMKLQQYGAQMQNIVKTQEEKQYWTDIVEGSGNIREFGIKAAKAGMKIDAHTGMMSLSDTPIGQAVDTSSGLHHDWTTSDINPDTDWSNRTSGFLISDPSTGKVQPKRFMEILQDAWINPLLASEDPEKIRRANSMLVVKDFLENQLATHKGKYKLNQLFESSLSILAPLTGKGNDEAKFLGSATALGDFLMGDTSVLTNNFAGESVVAGAISKQANLVSDAIANPGLFKQSEGAINGRSLEDALALVDMSKLNVEPTAEIEEMLQVGSEQVEESLARHNLHTQTIAYKNYYQQLKTKQVQEDLRRNARLDQMVASIDLSSLTNNFTESSLAVPSEPVSIPEPINISEPVSISEPVNISELKQDLFNIEPMISDEMIGQHSTESGIIKKTAKKTPWLAAGLGIAGVLGLTGLTFQSGGSDSLKAPSVPNINRNAKTRLMSNESSNTNYNANVYAKSSSDQNEDQYGKGLSNLGSSSINVNVQDHRRKIDDIARDHFRDQMKGR